MSITNQCKSTFTYALPNGGSGNGTQHSNTVTTENLTVAFTKVKTSNKTFLIEGETALQTVTLTNNSSTTIVSPTFRDTLSGAQYVAGSVKIDGTPKPAFDPAAGFPIPSIAVGHVVTVEYEITVPTLVATPVTNYATITYSVNDPRVGMTTFTENTNTVSLPVVSIKLTLTKTVNKSFAVVGDTLHYTTVVLNNGNTAKTNLFFTDEIPVGTTFNAGSVKIDGTTQTTFNPATGFALPDLGVGAHTTVEFDVTVV